MAKKGAPVEFVWLQCNDCGSLNYRTRVKTRGGIPEKLRAGLNKYCPRSRAHTVHKIKRK